MMMILPQGGNPVVFPLLFSLKLDFVAFKSLFSISFFVLSQVPPMPSRDAEIFSCTGFAPLTLS